MSDKGFFDNGRTGERLAVRLRAIDQGLEIRDGQDGLMLALWSHGDIVAVGRRRKTSLVLASRSDPGDRLSVADPALIARLGRSIPCLKPRRKRFPLRRLAIGLAATILALAVLYEGLLMGARPLALALPTSWEQELGARLAARLVAAYGGACQAPAGLAALASLGRRLTDDAQPPLPAHLQVVRSDHINAFILPGGQVILLSGLIREAGNADEVAAVVAHLLAHALAHHPTEQILRHAGFGLFFLLAGENAANPLSFLPFTRQAESEAEVAARRLLEQSAIPAQAMGNFFRRMALKEKTLGAAPDILSSHPFVDRRPDSGPSPPFTRPALTDGEWDSLRGICG